MIFLDENAWPRFVAAPGLCFVDGSERKLVRHDCYKRWALEETNSFS